MKKIITLLLCGTLFQSYAQRSSDNWDLRHCIEHAIQFNISIQQADVQARIAALQAKQAKLNVYPNVSANSGTGMRFGRSIDPTTNLFVNSQFLYQNFGVSGGVQLYNNGRIKYNQQTAEFNAKAALADVDKAKEDISFNVATNYLQILASKEQVAIAEVQIAQTLNQYDITKKRVNAGVLPELNLAEIESQLANDSSNYYTAKGNYEQNLLTMRALLNLETDVLFGIETPLVDQIPIEPFSELQPDLVYKMAMDYQPLIKANKFRIQAAQKNSLSTKALMYPTLSLGFNLQTNFSNSINFFNGANFQGYSPITGREPIVNYNNVNYYVQNPVYSLTQGKRTFGELWNGWGQQIDNNFGQNVGFNLSIPIFNASQARTSYRQSKLNLKSAELQRDLSDQKLKQDINIAYSNALMSLQKFNAGKKTVESAQKAYDFGTKRYESGLLSSLDLLTLQNNLLRSKVQQLSNQYDYVFKMKLLEFYKGNGIKL